MPANTMSNSLCPVPKTMFDIVIGIMDRGSRQCQILLPTSPVISSGPQHNVTGCCRTCSRGVKTMSNIATTSTHNHTHCVTTDSMSKASTMSVSVRPGSREFGGRFRFLFTKSKQNKTSHCMPRLTRDGSGIQGNVECMHSIDRVFRSVS